MDHIKNLTGQVLATLAEQRRSGIARAPGQPREVRQAANVTAAQMADCLAEFDTCRDAELETMLAAAAQFCTDMASSGTPAYWLTFLGDPGCGKTMLAKRIVRFFRRHLDGLRDEHYDPAKEVRYRTGGLKAWGDVLLEMVAGDYTGLRNLREDWLVAIDDVGAEYDRHRELSRAKLFEVLNARLGKWTILTANLSLEGIRDQLDPRIASRLLRDGSKVIDSKAVDFSRRARR